jgi:hypothetical protein
VRFPILTYGAVEEPYGDIEPSRCEGLARKETDGFIENDKVTMTKK